ncbi:ATP-binding protein [Pseudodonghicola sp.]|uniref:ATP-binding protein n=1 Tax=Pseudodonghicola sp. TaxID=1969463 RepID=UPI003A97CF78
MTTNEALSVMEKIRANAVATTALDTFFCETETYRMIRERVFGVLEAREIRLARGLYEQKGAALIGPAGSGKSTMMARVIREYEEAAVATGGRAFGHRIVSAIVPGKASVKDTCCAILREIGYPTRSNRTEDYLIDCLRTQLQHHRIAAIHLDEVQDAGRYATEETMSAFAKRFRNLMQVGPWPVSLIMTATLEAKKLINHDPTLSRRLRPVEILAMTPTTDGSALRGAMTELLRRSGLTDDGMFNHAEFTPLMMHAAAYRFGLAVEITIEALSEAVEMADARVTLDHFAEAYYVRTNCDDELNPFLSDHWRGIDTTRAMDRFYEEKNDAKKPRKRK